MLQKIHCIGWQRDLKDRTLSILQVVRCTPKPIYDVRNLKHAKDKNGVRSTARGAIYSCPGLTYWGAWFSLMLLNLSFHRSSLLRHLSELLGFLSCIRFFCHRQCLAKSSFMIFVACSSARSPSYLFLLLIFVYLKCAFVVAILSLIIFFKKVGIKERE